MAYRFMQQYPRPAGAQHYRQGASRRRDRFQVHQGLAQCLTGIAHDPLLGEEAIVGTPAATLAAALTAAILFDDDTDIEAHQRPHIGRQAAVSGCNQNALPDPGHAHADLLDTRIQRPRSGIDAL